VGGERNGRTKWVVVEAVVAVVVEIGVVMFVVVAGGARVESI
jgi:hypothetical protein